MLNLPHGCKCSAPAVFPKNWRNGSVKKGWYIYYRFYDAAGNSKLVITKRMNSLKTLPERRAITEDYLRDIIIDLKNGYNPISKKIRQIQIKTDTIDPGTTLPAALEFAREKMKAGERTKSGLKSVLNFVQKAIPVAGLLDHPISETKRKHVMMILECCGKINSNWTANNFNYFRSRLYMLFKVLTTYEAIENNPVVGIEKEPVVKKIRPTLSVEDRARVDNHLRSNYYTFWRFMQIFFHSGCRESELMQIKVKDVDLQRQKFKMIVRKRKVFEEVERTIKDIALPFWEELLNGAGSEDYIFSRGLVPGVRAIRPDQITKRWYRLVKSDMKLGIKEDFYSLKHLNTTQIVDRLGDMDAAAMNAHKSTSMVVSIYDVKRSDRQHERLKKVNNTF